LDPYSPPHCPFECMLDLKIVLLYLVCLPLRLKPPAA
jgi:hypothetical protein